jgi:hypothetical protein
MPKLQDQMRLYRRDLLHSRVWRAGVRQSRSPDCHSAMNVHEVHEYALRRGHEGK